MKEVVKKQIGCSEGECRGRSFAEGLCRLHYLKNWKTVRGSVPLVTGRTNGANRDTGPTITDLWGEEPVAEGVLPQESHEGIDDDREVVESLVGRPRNPTTEVGDASRFRRGFDFLPEANEAEEEA